MRPVNYILFISTLLLTFNAAAAVEKFSILSSSAQGYKKGDVVSNTQTVKLQKGEKLQIKSLKTASKCDVVGPYAAALKCAHLVLAAERVRPRQRSASDLPPSVWAVDIERGSNFCYRHADELKLWRKDADNAVLLGVKNFSDTQQVRLRWPATQSLLDWPAQRLPLVDRGTYVFTFQGSGTATAINFYQQPEHLQSQAEVEQWMQQQGCTNQLSILQDDAALLAN